MWLGYIDCLRGYRQACLSMLIHTGGCVYLPLANLAHDTTWVMISDDIHGPCVPLFAKSRSNYLIFNSPLLI